MTKQEKDIVRTKRSIVGLFNFITEALGWLQIVASLCMIGIVVGAIIYFTEPKFSRLIIGISLATIGLISGNIWRQNNGKEEGQSSFCLEYLLHLN